MDEQIRTPRFGDRSPDELQAIVPDFDAEATGVVFNLIRASNRIVQDLETVVHRPAGLSWAGFRILYTIDAMGPTEPRQLARFSGVTRASVSSVLKTLERDGLVSRERGVADKRAVRVSLTARGQTVVREAMRRQNARERAWVSCLGHEERTALAGLLRRLIHHRPAADGAQPEPPH